MLRPTWPTWLSRSQGRLAVFNCTVPLNKLQRGCLCAIKQKKARKIYARLLENVGSLLATPQIVPPSKRQFTVHGSGSSVHELRLHAAAFDTTSGCWFFYIKCKSLRCSLVNELKTTTERLLSKQSSI
eukprot:170221-Chlamydomonas_euryale.AAC.1